MFYNSFGNIKLTKNLRRIDLKQCLHFGMNVKNIKMKIICFNIKFQNPLNDIKTLSKKLDPVLASLCPSPLTVTEQRVVAT